MPEEILQLTIDKFVFRFPTGLQYSNAGVWLRREGRHARLGISDFVQQKSGDITFATLVPVGTTMRAGDEVGTIETVKAAVVVFSPVGGTVVGVNERLEREAELVNQDPYGEGWLAVIEPGDGEEEQPELLDAHGYLEVARRQAEAELA